MGDTPESAGPRAPSSDLVPNLIADYASTCVQYVRTSVGIAPDFTAETLPLVDHYLRGARTPVGGRPEALDLVATVTGAYLGEVIRRRHPFAWQTDDPDPIRWRLDWQLGDFSVFPIAIAHVALAGTQAEKGLELLHINPEQRRAIADRLAMLPPVSEEDYLAPSTRVEVIDLVIAALTPAAPDPQHHDIDPDDEV